MTGTIDHIPEGQKVPEVPQRLLSVTFQVLQHGELEVITGSLVVVDTQSPLGDSHSLPLEPERAADVDTKRLFGVRVLLRRNLLDLESSDLVDGLSIRVIHGRDFGVDDRVNRLVELDSLQHKVETKFDLATVDGVSASFKDLLRDRNLKISLPSAQNLETRREDNSRKEQWT